MTLIGEQSIIAAAQRLLEASPKGTEVILFGSRARGEAAPASDIDFLVVQPHVAGRLREAARLARVLRPMRLPVDLVVVDQETYLQWQSAPSSVCNEAHREGRVFRATSETPDHP